MQCREFQEISEAYLSDELLVETNIQVFRHLENCPKCRAEFAAKRQLRLQMRSAVRHAPEFQIDPGFANRLSANLKETVLYENTWRKLFFAPKLMIPVMASLLYAVALGFVALNWTNKNGEITLSSDVITKTLTQIALAAVGGHKDCALEKMQMWEKMSKQDYAEKAVYTEKIVNPLRANFSENVEMLHAHDCIFEGKEFTHVILRKGVHTVSVFFDKSDVLPEADNSANASIICEKENGLQVASFQQNRQPIFVISDMTETENLSAARALSDAWQNARI